MKTYFIESVGESIVFGKAVPSHYSFRIVDERGEPIKYFQAGRGKLFYLGIIRKDLNYFQHLRPTYERETGIFTVPDLKFPDEGEYRLCANFSPLDTGLAEERPPQASAYIDITVGGKGNPPPPKTREEILGIYSVILKTKPETPKTGPVSIYFYIKIDEKPMTEFEDHFGSKGHLSIFRYETLDFGHQVAKEILGTQMGKLEFEVKLEKRGTYKMFLEFKHSDKVTTGDFELEVKI